MSGQFRFWLMDEQGIIDSTGTETFAKESKLAKLSAVFWCFAAR